MSIRNISLIVALLILTSIFIGYKAYKNLDYETIFLPVQNSMKKNVDKKPILDNNFDRQTILNDLDYNFNDGVMLIGGNTSFNVSIADTAYKRTQGLSGVKHIKPNQGMFFVFDEPDLYTFWMDGMLFDLDFIWIKDNTVIDIIRNVSSLPSNQSTLYRPTSPITNVLEVSAGQADSIKIGDNVEFINIID